MEAAHKTASSSHSSSVPDKFPQQKPSVSGAASSAAMALKKAALDAMSSPWDPLHCPEWDGATPSPHATKRLQRDLSSLFTDPPHGIFVVPDEKNMLLIHALVIGPYDTPYEGGFFYFIVRVPPDYPFKPPRVRLVTTDSHRVRFNPNLYANGKVCLSILGTWSGPEWAASLTLETALLSIQSLMNEKPYHNEPGFSSERTPGEVDSYNDVITHETLRVAVCGMLDSPKHGDSKTMPQALSEVARASFPQFYDGYISMLEKLKGKGLQGRPMSDPFSERNGAVFDVEGIRKRLVALKEVLCKDESPS